MNAGTPQPGEPTDEAQLQAKLERLASTYFEKFSTPVFRMQELIGFHKNHWLLSDDFKMAYDQPVGLIKGKAPLSFIDSPPHNVCDLFSHLTNPCQWLQVRTHLIKPVICQASLHELCKSIPQLTNSRQWLQVWTRLTPTAVFWWCRRTQS